MKKIFLLLIFFILLLVSVEKGEAKMGEDVFEIEIKLYTAQEIKEFFPSMELEDVYIEINGKEYLHEDTTYTSYNYLFGWVKFKKGELGVFTRQKMFPGCKITAWNRFFKHTFSVGVDPKQKSYFLIPLGVYIGDRNFEYRVSTVP